MKKIARWYAAGGWLAVLLGVLGFASSCDKHHKDPPVEYGVPSANYEVLGTVKLSADQNPLAGVQVRVLQKMPDGQYYSYDKLPRTETDVQGRFTVRESVFPGHVLPLELVKLGYVKTDTVDVSLKDVPLSGGNGRWYEGEGSKMVEIMLDAVPQDCAPQSE